MDFTRSHGLSRRVLESSENRVCISCRTGYQRTAAVLIAYHDYSRRLRYEAALAELQKGRQTLQPLPHQEKATRHYLAMLADSRLD